MTAAQPHNSILIPGSQRVPCFLKNKKQNKKNNYFMSARCECSSDDFDRCSSLAKTAGAFFSLSRKLSPRLKITVSETTLTLSFRPTPKLRLTDRGL